MKKILSIVAIMSLVALVACAAACTSDESGPDLDNLLQAMSYDGTEERPDHVYIRVQNDQAGVIYDYRDGVVVENLYNFDDGDFALGGVSDGLKFTKETFKTVSAETSMGNYVVKGELANARTFLGVDTDAATVEAVVSTDTGIMTRLTISYTTDNGNDVVVSVVE